MAAVGRDARLARHARGDGRMTPPLRCALYTRVSTDEQAERYGLSSQLTELRALATRRAYAIVGEFVDDGWSGATLDRPKLTALRSLLRARGLDVILVHASDRLARDLGDLLVLRVEVRRAAARIEYVSHSPDETPEGELREQMLGAIAQYERAKIRERTSRGRSEKAPRGLVPSGPIPLGYRRDPSSPGGYAIAEDDAAAVRRIFGWLLDGGSIRTICRRLDAHGPRPHRGGRWQTSSLRRLLTCEQYIGRAWYNRRTGGKGSATFRDAAQWIPIAVPPIVSQATWDRVQAQLQRNVALMGHQPTHVYFLGGLLVCGRCGRRMHGDREHGRPVYRCAGRLKPDDRPICRVRVSARTLDAALWRDLVAVIRDPDVLGSAAKSTRLGIDAQRVETSSEAEELAESVARVTTRRTRLLDLYLEGRVDRLTFDTRERPLVAEEARFQRQLDEVRARLAAGQANADRHAAAVRYCRLVARGLDRLDERGRQDLVRRILTQIVVHADRLEVHGAIPIGAPQPPRPDRASRRSGSRLASPGALFRVSGDWE